MKNSNVARRLPIGVVDVIAFIIEDVLGYVPVDLSGSSSVVLDNTVVRRSGNIPKKTSNEKNI